MKWFQRLPSTIGAALLVIHCPASHHCGLKIVERVVILLYCDTYLLSLEKIIGNVMTIVKHSENN